MLFQNQQSLSNAPNNNLEQFQFNNELGPGQSDASYNEHMKKLKEKFIEIKEEIQQLPKDLDVFKNHQLPLARVKKIMKSDEDVRMISSEAPVLFAKACEIFIIELTHRAWLFTELWI
ncbi:Histone-fold [Pseudocohnilembus persalinus]|uniref:Histone-fold n=1 Tax=Pseudocohnilembus persalinus TaxID=266149 RepID=A0A0V0QDI9_PSEPJ|nr:Histone-fold [Pseudocohnilembus persalinus]|eukprot:KRX00273.1 Histone-fold [Pseudocohnilembus persalinus]